MKRLLTLILALSLAAVTAACGAEAPPPLTPDDDKTTTTTTTTTTAAVKPPEPPPSLIVPFAEITIESIMELNNFYADFELPEIEYNSSGEETVNRKIHRFPDGSLAYINVMYFNREPDANALITIKRINFHPDGFLGGVSGDVFPHAIHDCEENAWVVIQSYAHLFGIDFDDPDMELKPHNHYSHELSVRFGYKQYYKGLEVEGGIYIFVDPETGMVRSVISYYMANIDIDITPQITLDDALQIAADVSDSIHFNPSGVCGNGCSNELIIFADERREPRLTWRTNAFSKEENICAIYVCALSGDIIEKRPIHAM